MADRYLTRFVWQGPFDGVLGFSQGAAVVALLCSLQSKQQRISSSPTSYGKSSASVGALEPFDSIDDVSSAEREAACAPVLNYQFQSVRFRFAMVAGGFVPRREELGSLFDDIGTVGRSLLYPSPSLNSV